MYLTMSICLEINRYGSGDEYAAQRRLTLAVANEHEI